MSEKVERVYKIGEESIQVGSERNCIKIKLDDFVLMADGTLYIDPDEVEDIYEGLKAIVDDWRGK